jgi:DNA replication and repair protein RecF
MDDTSVAISAIQLTQVHLKNFRCFQQLDIALDAPYVVLTGVNGVGKTSILEALYYSCYLRSFRTHSPRELVAFGANEFFVKIALHSSASQLTHTIQAGFSHNKRLVKIDQKSVVSYKDLMAYYRIISITENDLALVQGGPESRRLFMDHMLLLVDDEYAAMLKTYRHVVDQRNAFLMQRSMHKASYMILTQQVWQLAVGIEQRRRALLTQIEQLVNQRGIAFIHQFVPLQFSYYPRRALTESFDQFCQHNSTLADQEQRFGRTLFGPHLDDVQISFQGQLSRLFASRGQQKMIVLLIKMAQLELLAKRGVPGICLLDDFMTDFDNAHIASLLNALKGLGTQLIFTNPLHQSPLENQINSWGKSQSIRLTI